MPPEAPRLPSHRPRRRVLCIGDAHFPWVSRRTLGAIYRAIRRHEPEYVIQLGDLYDLFSFGRFPRTQNVYTPQQELALGRKDAELFWRTVQDCAPRATLYQLYGNHDARLVKRALAAAPELETFARDGVMSLMRFPDVETVADYREVLMIDDVCYHHGYLPRLGDHARSFNANMVVGHTHLGGVACIKTEQGIFWELNAGFIANRHAVPLSYTEQRRFSRWTLGYGLVDEYGARFVPLNTEEDR